MLSKSFGSEKYQIIEVPCNALLLPVSDFWDFDDSNDEVIKRLEKTSAKRLRLFHGLV